MNLQGDHGANEARATETPFLNPEPLDIGDAAATIALADLVVTVDTMISHLTNALGRPVWLLLPAECDWRWTREGDRSRWYPTVRLYRQATQGDWRDPLTRVAADPKAWVRGERARA